MAEFVDPHLGVIAAQEQKHAHAHAATVVPPGHDAATINLVRFVAIAKIHDETYQRLGKSPSPLPKPENQLLHFTNLATI